MTLQTDTLSLTDLHAAVVARWTATPGLTPYINGYLYYGPDEPFLSEGFLKWALTASVADMLVYHQVCNAMDPDDLPPAVQYAYNSRGVLIEYVSI